MGQAKKEWEASFVEARVDCSRCSANQPESWMEMFSGDGERWYLCKKCLKASGEEAMAELLDLDTPAK
jgi:hypothetical protein